MLMILIVKIALAAQPWAENEGAVHGSVKYERS
jgi:hypothetical protein